MHQLSEFNLGQHITEKIHGDAVLNNCRMYLCKQNIFDKMVAMLHGVFQESENLVMLLLCSVMSTIMPWLKDDRWATLDDEMALILWFT